VRYKTVIFSSLAVLKVDLSFLLYCSSLHFLLLRPRLHLLGSRKSF
jgi:hypothetical protein